jgi:hypothetical protein
MRGNYLRIFNGVGYHGMDGWCVLYLLASRHVWIYRCR